MIPSIASTTGRVGEALAGTLVDGIPGTSGGGRYQARKIVESKLGPAPFAGATTTLVTPDGDKVTTGLMPLGELLAAQRASDAPYVESASSEAPAGVARIAMRGMLALMHLTPLRRFAARRLADIKHPSVQPLEATRGRTPTSPGPTALLGKVGCVWEMPTT